MSLVRHILITPALVLVVACTNQTTETRIHASGHIEATDIRLASKNGGQLVDFSCREGQRIERGSIVARIDTADLEHTLRQARAEEAGAAAQLRLLLSGSRAEDLRRAEEQLAAAQAEIDAARRDVTRLEGLESRGSATEKALDDARTRFEIASRQGAAARSALDKLISGPRREEIEIARAHRSALQARIASIEQKITDATIIAPTSGVLTTRIAEPGEILAPGSPVGILSDLDRPWLSVFVDEPNLAAIRLGNEVDVEVDGLDQELTGTVAFISPIAEFTPKNVQTPDERAKLVFQVKIDLSNPDGLFKIGMPADAYFDPVAHHE